MILSLLTATVVFAGVHSATYEVPVPEELKSVATFQLSGVEVVETAESVSISYALPIELTGNYKSMSFSGVPSQAGEPLILSSEDGKLVCNSLKDLASCAASYKDLKINVEARSEFLKAISKDEFELQLREHVASSFCAKRVLLFAASSGGGEPCGFLNIDLNSY